MSKGNRRKKDKEKKLKRRRRFLFIIGTFSIFYILTSLLFGDLGLMRHIEMKRIAIRLETEIKRLKEENGKINKEVEALKYNPQLIEKIAREKLGLVKDGEIIYKYTDRPAYSLSAGREAIDE